jgi:hypothetical protein
MITRKRTKDKQWSTNHYTEKEGATWTPDKIIGQFRGYIFQFYHSVVLTKLTPTVSKKKKKYFLNVHVWNTLCNNSKWNCGAVYEDPIHYILECLLYLNELHLSSKSIIGCVTKSDCNITGTLSDMDII